MENTRKNLWNIFNKAKSARHETKTDDVQCIQKLLKTNFILQKIFGQREVYKGISQSIRIYVCTDVQTGLLKSLEACLMYRSFKIRQKQH